MRRVWRRIWRSIDDSFFKKTKTTPLSEVRTDDVGLIQRNELPFQPSSSSDGDELTL